MEWIKEKIYKLGQFISTILIFSPFVVLFMYDKLNTKELIGLLLISCCYSYYTYKNLKL